MNSETVPAFWELYRRLPKPIRKQARDAYGLFQANPAHPSLHFHRLAGHPELWSARVTRNFRAVGLVVQNHGSWNSRKLFREKSIDPFLKQVK